MKPIPTIDGHHHIWRLKDLSWLSGPAVPRIFGPYQPICRDYTIDEFRADIAECNVVKSIYVQTNWPAGQSFDEALWVQSVAESTGWPHANVAHADLADPDVGSLLKRLKSLSLTRGIRQQLHWHENSQYSFAPRADVMASREWQRGLALVSDLGLLFELQVFTSQMTDSVKLARSFPDTTFLLEHAGMLEDTSQEGWKRWRDGMSSLSACKNVHVKLSGLGTFEHAYNDATVAPIIRETVAMFGSDRCLFGSNFPIEKLWTDYATLYANFRTAIEHLSEKQQNDVLHDTAARLYGI